MFVVTVIFFYLRDNDFWGGKMAPNHKVREIFDVLDKHAINEFDKYELLEYMYDGLVYGLGDPYSAYFDESDLEKFNEQTEGVYGGVGLEVYLEPEDGLVTVFNVYDGTPGDKAGIVPGDKLVGVDGVDVRGKQLHEVTSVTKGTPGTEVLLTVYRPETDDTYDIIIIREVISIPTVSHTMHGDIGYIYIKSFERITLGQFAQALRELRQNGMTGLVLDLRNNPGGLLDTVAQIGNLLLPRGLITYTENKQGERRYYESDEMSLDLPLVLLINEHSASASEVLAGAVRDLNAGVLVGTKTFGKGIVQNLFNLSDGSAVKVTVSKYYTPNGTSIHDVGIIPDYIIETDEETTRRAGLLDPENDNQLKFAIDLLNGE